jgi:hypothetical protein
MTNFAVINKNDSIVESVYVAEITEDINEDPETVIEVTEETGQAGIGFTWNGSEFINPETGTKYE